MCDDRLLGFFSGFPSHHFPPRVAEQLGKGLSQRDTLVFVSAWPSEYAKNDSDAAGMHAMFAACNLPFARCQVLDNRMEAACARQWVREASCVFLMGGHPGWQRQWMRDTGVDDAICSASCAVLGVSAGAINMAERALDTKESTRPYEGLGLADITVKPHFTLDNRQVLATLLPISMQLPLYAMQDDSAIFVLGDSMTHTGQIYWVDRGTLAPLANGEAR